MKIHRIAAILIAGCLLTGMAPEGATRAEKIVPQDRPAAIERMTEYRTQHLALPRAAGEPFTVIVDLDGAVRELELTPHSLRAPDFRVLVAGDDGALTQVEAPAPATYRGTVKGVPSSRASASLVDGKLTAYIDLGEGVGVFCVQPVSEVSKAPAARDEHVSFRTSAMLPSGLGCGVEDVEGEAPEEQEEAAAAGPADGTALKVCEIALDGDFFFYQENGSSIGNTIGDMESVMNEVEFVYERDTGITYEITVIIVRSSFASDPYSSAVPSELLCEFRTAWNSVPENGIRRDVAQLFTGRSISSGSGTIGLAYQGTVCNETGTGQGCPAFGNLAYSIVESRFGGSFDERVSLSAHELGHSWNSGHCTGTSCHIMCATVNDCGGTIGENLKFGPQSITVISSYRNSRQCLLDLPAPLTVPFFDDIPSNPLDPTKWTWQFFAVASDDAIDPPSAPYAMRIWSAGSAEYKDGEVRSNEILLAGESDLIVSYQVQWQGVEANKYLLSEYLADTGNWGPLSVISSPGIDLGIFLEYSHDLPADAYHDGFRLRFRVLGDQIDDRWFVDDIYVGPEGGMDCPGDIDGSGDIGFQDLLSILSNWGPCLGCPEDIDGSGDVGFTDLLHVLSNWGPCP